jgi:SAM-dependent methyltransferase
MAQDVVIRTDAIGQRRLRSTPTTQELYVQYGACAPEGWLNFDASPRLRLERLVGARRLLKRSAGLVFPANANPGNIVKGLPVPDQAVAGVFCSQLLEHLPRDATESALRNTFRMLRPGGLFRLVVPDLQ